jgi:hypothetical protein
MEDLTFDQIENIMDLEAGGIKFRDMTAITFKQYVLSKINGMKTYDPKVMEISVFCNSLTMSRTMPLDQKLDLLKKIKNMGLDIP